MSEIEYRDVVLKSLHPEQYPDKVVRCRVIQNEDINAYIDAISDEEKMVATKTAPVEARLGQVGETVHTTLTTVYEGNEYILSEEDNVVGEREMGDGTMAPDVVVTNVNSTSNEQYVVKANKFSNMYEPNDDGTFTPAPDPRELTRVSEDIIIMTAWGAPAVCLAGSYIVTYDAASNDFNTIEQGAFNSTYEVQRSLGKQL